MWNPFRRKKIHAVLVSETQPAPAPDARIERQIEVASLRSLLERQKVRNITGQIHESLATRALVEMRGGRS